MKRLARVAAVLLVLAAPGFAGAQSEGEEGPVAAPAATPQVAAVRRDRSPRSCKVITNQIAHYEDVAEMARARGDERWEEGTEAQIDRLLLQQQRRCPQDLGPSNAERVARLLELVAKGFMTAATFGAF